MKYLFSLSSGLVSYSQGGVVGGVGGAPGSIMMPGTITPLFRNPFPGNRTTCAIVCRALLARPRCLALAGDTERESWLSSDAHSSRAGGQVQRTGAWPHAGPFCALNHNNAATNLCASAAEFQVLNHAAPFTCGFISAMLP